VLTLNGFAVRAQDVSLSFRDCRAARRQGFVEGGRDATATERLAKVRRQPIPVGSRLGETIRRPMFEAPTRDSRRAQLLRRQRNALFFARLAPAAKGQGDYALGYAGNMITFVLIGVRE
jgi:hypothetical protein